MRLLTRSEHDRPRLAVVDAEIERVGRLVNVCRIVET